MLTIEELRKLDAKALQEELNKAQHDLTKHKLLVENQTSQKSDTLSKIKKYIAQINTVQTEQKSLTANNV